MAKLLFETDDGEQREVKLSTVKTRNLGEDDVVMATYEVGEISEDQKQMAGAELLRLKQMLEQAFPEGTKILVAASRNGKEDVSIKIIKDKTK
jgi:hypothetical protein